MAKVNFTAGRIDEFRCPEGKAQAFMWDAKAPGLALRVTANGARSYVFQGRFNGQTLRQTIGSPEVWRIPDAQAEARRLQGLIDQGKDPRLDKAAATARDVATRTAARSEKLRLEVTGLQAWSAYCDERRPSWSVRNYADHLRFASPGGVQRRRAKAMTKAGPLHSLLLYPLVAIDESAVQAWVTLETRTRPASAQLGFRLLRAFMNWCAEHRDYKALVNADACKGKKTREKLGKPKAKNDSLQREQLKAWFAEVRRDPNPVASAYLQALLITGARREELMALRWADVDFQWKSLRLRDKVEGERTIPLTPHVARLLSWLPKRNGWVFSSEQSESGRLQEPRPNHMRALAAAGLPHVSLHGLRRSFGTLAEWVEVPVGIVAQIQGHKPSAIAEKHYRVRPIDLLRMWHERIEAWMLEQADIALPSTEHAPAMRVVSAA